MSGYGEERRQYLVRDAEVFDGVASNKHLWNLPESVTILRGNDELKPQQDERVHVDQGRGVSPHGIERDTVKQRPPLLH